MKMMQKLKMNSWKIFKKKMKIKMKIKKTIKNNTYIKKK